MELTVHIPDDIAARLGADGADLSHRALENFAAEEYRAGRLHKPDLRRVLGFETRDEIHAFLRQHGIDESFTVEEIEQQVESMERLGF